MKITFPIVFFLCLLVGCVGNSSGLKENVNSENQNLTVSAAVSLKDAFNEIGAIYRAKTGRTINFNFGASGALQKQIETGAPVDAFASAGERQMDELEAKDLIDKETRRNFARNKLVLILPPDSKSNVADFTDLSKADVVKIAVGNPKTVPAGQYTEQVFDRMNIKNSLQAKLIFAEDVRQVLDYVVRGEVDAGIVYATDAKTAGEKVRVAAVAAENAHAPILYPIAAIKESAQKQAASEFVDLVLSSEGQNILRKYGFAPASDK